MPVQITARVDGFRRCGMAHSAKTQTYPDDHFSVAQLAVLENEPQLIVVRVSGDAATNSDTATELSAARKLIAKLEANAMKYVDEISTLNERLDAVTVECHTLKESNAALVTERDALKESNTALTTERDALQAQLAKADAAKAAKK
ncbi:HI1506-related protein [Pectobacterium actinidiae]|uniref:HI1506-related protein n=1 Tax=Pectobacterium actinidiae TaxID=1507808 RepID=A0ABW8G7C7_9GAMM